MSVHTDPDAHPNPGHVPDLLPELPVSTALGHRARVGDEVNFAYAGGASILLTTTAKVVFVWPGDELDLDVKVPGDGTERREHVRPHLGEEVRPNTWWR